MIFVDTDIIIDIYRGYLPSIEWKNTIQDEIILSGYTGFELISGCINSKDLSKIKNALNSYNLIWASNEACKEAFNTFQN